MYSNKNLTTSSLSHRVLTSFTLVELCFKLSNEIIYFCVEFRVQSSLRRPESSFLLSRFLLQGSNTTRRAPRRTSMCGRSSSAWSTSSVWRCLSAWTSRRPRLQAPRPPDWPTSPPSYLRSAVDRPPRVIPLLSPRPPPGSREKDKNRLTVVTFLSTLSASVHVCEQSIIPMPTNIYITSLIPVPPQVPRLALL